MRTVLLFILLLVSLIANSQIPEYSKTVYKGGAHGYYFLAEISAAKSTLMILDKSGNIVCYRPHTNGFNFALQPNGMMSYASTGKFLLMDSTFNIVDSVSCKNLFETDKHDFRILPNGHYLMLGSELDTMDISPYRFLHRGADTTLSNVRRVIWSVVQELDSARNVVFEWHTKDHFKFSEADSFHLKSLAVVDLTHSNSIEPDRDGNILLSTRNFNEVTKINRADGSIMWRLGGTQNQFKFVNCPIPFHTQHDVRRISNGHITLLDGGLYIDTIASRAMEFELDEVHKIATLKWCYVFDSAMYGSGQGNVQRMPNGNTLISYGRTIGSNVCFVVIDSGGSKIFQLDSIKTYRALHYESLPWQLHRPEITRFDSLGVCYLKASIGAGAYRWSNGDTGRVIRISGPGDYSVSVPYGQGWFISSENFRVTAIARLKRKVK